MKLLKSIVLVFGLLSIASFVTNAYFSDQVTATNNQFSAGTWIGPNKVVINEIYSNPATGEIEWIELFNINSQALNLTNYTIGDGTTATPKNLSPYSIPIGGYLVLNKGADFSFILNNSGDIVKLKESGIMIDQVVYGNWDDGITADNAPAPAMGESVARIPNGHDTIPDNDLADFQIDITPTKGIENVL